MITIRPGAALATASSQLDDLPLSGLIMPVVPVLAAVLVAALYLAGRRMRPVAHTEPGAAEAARVRARSAARTLLDTVRIGYTRHISDPDLLLRTPALLDPAVPAVGEFRRALTDAQEHAAPATSDPTDRDREFLLAVSRLARAWGDARSVATLIGYSRLTEAERGAVHRTLDLLATARSSVVGPVRDLAVRQAAEQLDELIRTSSEHLRPSLRLARGALGPTRPAPGPD